jgi:hypothetical protein
MTHMTEQHPKITVAWAIASLERALNELGNSPAEARTRRQFHQLLLALERDGHVLLDARDGAPAHKSGRVLTMRRRGTGRMEPPGSNDDGGARIA